MSYSPKVPPQDLKDILQFLDDEFMRVAQALNSSISGEYDILYNAPSRIFPGLVVYADGTSWDPGSGEGLYRRSLSNTWVKVG